MHMYVFIIQKLSVKAGAVRSGIIELEICAVLLNKGQDDRAQYLIEVSDINQINNNDILLLAMTMGYFRPNQYSSTAMYHPNYDGDVSISLPSAAPHTLSPICSVKQETWLVTEAAIPPSC